MNTDRLRLIPVVGVPPGCTAWYIVINNKGVAVRWQWTRTDALDEAHAKALRLGIDPEQLPIVEVEGGGLILLNAVYAGDGDEDDEDDGN